MTVRRRRPDGSRSRGQALVELAFVLPVFLLLLMILFDFGRVIYAQHTIDQDASEAARKGSVSADKLVVNGSCTAGSNPRTCFADMFADIRAAGTLMAPAVPINALNTAAASIKGATGACSAAGGTPAMPDDGATGACFYPNGVTNADPANPPKIVVNITAQVPLITPIISNIVGSPITVRATSERLLQ